jgi:hypothetical protein
MDITIDIPKDLATKRISINPNFGLVVYNVYKKVI